jgi:hypothetical protein
MATTNPSAALVSVTPVFTNTERLALAGFLAGYSGLTPQAYELDLRQYAAWCQHHQLRLFAARRADILRVPRHPAGPQRTRRTALRSRPRHAGRARAVLLLLYAQTPAAISRLTLDQLDTTHHQVALRFGREPVLLPEPVSDLVRELAATRRGHAALGDQGTSHWLFPGGRPGQPISSYQLAERLRQLGLRPAQARSTALFGLATNYPPPCSPDCSAST